MTFANKLNALVTLTGTTNAKISRGSNTDPSMVSKWRKGVRTPSNNMETLMALAEYFSGRVTVDYQRDTLSGLVGRPIASTQDKAGVRDAIFTWLVEGTFAGPGEGAAEKAAPGKERLPRKYQSKMSTVEYKYTGKKGREKVLRACFEQLEKRGEAVTLYIYYDETPDWAAFTGNCLARMEKTRQAAFGLIEEVNILVPTEVALTDMGGVLGVAMPFSGHSRVLIHHTARLRPGLLQHLIMASHGFMSVTSLGMHGSTYISTIMHNDPDYVNSVTDTLAANIKTSQQALERHAGRSIWDTFRQAGDIFRYQEDILAIGHTAGLFAVPPPVLARILDAAGTPATEEDMAWFCRVAQTDMPVFLAHNSLYCHIPLFMPEEVAGGAVTLPHVPRLRGGAPVVGPADYLEMLKTIYRLTTAHPNFVFTYSSQHFPAAASIAQRRHIAVFSQPGPHMADYVSKSANIATACYDALYETMKDALAPNRRQDCRHRLAAHIELYENKLHAG